MKLKHFYLVFLAVLVFLIPSNLFLKFFVNTTYVRGYLVDYLLPKLYLSDLPIFALFALWFWEKKNVLKKIKFTKVSIFFAGLVLLFFVRQFFTDRPLASIWFFVKLLEMSLLAVFLFQHRFLLRSRIIIGAWCMTLVFQSIIAMTQFSTQSSVAHSYLFFGEPELRQTVGIKKTDVNGAEKILPFGTTAHPNVLGGFLALGILGLVISGVGMLVLLPVTLIGGIALLLTHASIAWMSTILGILLWKFRKRFFISARGWAGVVLLTFICVPIVVHFLALQSPQNLSFTRRDALNQGAVEMFLSQPILGVGLNNSTVHIEQFHNLQEVTRFLQPAHHILLLWLAETGGIGIVMFIFLVKKIRKHLSPQFLLLSLTLLPIATLDHYLLSLQTGELLLVWFLILLMAIDSNDRAGHDSAAD